MSSLKTISILGSTGSIGINTLDIISRNPDQFKVVALSAGQNKELLLKQIELHKPGLVSILKEEDAKEIKKAVPAGVEVLYGEKGNEAVATYEDAEIVVSAIMGKEAVLPTYRAIQKGKTIALAAKEILVSCGEFIIQEAEHRQVSIIPIDSEHSGVFQCLQGENKGTVEKVLLTASGGPFLHYSREVLKTVTVHESLQHPNWKMGK